VEDKPASCQVDGAGPAGDVLPCLANRCAALERSMRLDPVDVRTVSISQSFDASHPYPACARVGLFKVLGPASVAGRR
jgi:hypothetical protein